MRGLRSSCSQVSGSDHSLDNKDQVYYLSGPLLRSEREHNKGTICFVGLEITMTETGSYCGNLKLVVLFFLMRFIYSKCFSHHIS